MDNDYELINSKYIPVICLLAIGCILDIVRKPSEFIYSILIFVAIMIYFFIRSAMDYEKQLQEEQRIRSLNKGREEFVYNRIKNRYYPKFDEHGNRYDPIDRRYISQAEFAKKYEKDK